MEILGQSIVQRVVMRLWRADIDDISVITDPRGSFPHSRDVKISVADTMEHRWAAAERTLQQKSLQRDRILLIAELGAYAEFDVAAALQFHRAQRQPVTPLHDGIGPLGYWLVDADFLSPIHARRLPLNEDELDPPPVPYLVHGYVNRLADARDLRRLVVDAFMGRCAILPDGQEIKPGIWIGEGAKLHPTARVVAPAYLGRNVRVHPEAVITRFSNLERHCDVGEGSVVDGSSVLPHTVIGRGLDVSAAVVDGQHFVDLSRNIAFEIQDPALISVAGPRKHNIPVDTYEHEELERPPQPLEPEYSQYLARAAGRLLEVFKGEV